MKKAFCVLATCILSLCCVLCAEAKTVSPLEHAPDSYDLANGEFCAGVDDPSTIPEGQFTLTLALEDWYAAEEIAGLEPGDTVVAGGKEYTVELVVIHGEYDEDGDGEYDGSTTTVRDAEKYRDIIDRLELDITEDPDREIVPYTYEVCAKGEYDSLSFLVDKDAGCHAVINDCTLFTVVGTTEVRLPLPDSFAYYYFSAGEENGPLPAETFLEDVTTYGSFNPYNTNVRMENGLPVRIDHSSYPEGPES